MSHLHRIVALGGGTGMPAVLRGLRGLVSGGNVADLTAVVAMTDDGGSSGRLRESFGLPPPGDVRKCLVALSPDENILAGLFQHRYAQGHELEGHTLGNLILAALAEQTGSFLRAVEVSSRVLRTAGRILPATLQDVRLKALLEDGTELIGETQIAECGRRVRRIELHPGPVPAAPGVVESILAADLVVVGPGSLFTSVVPNLVVDGVADALQRTTAVVVLVANIVSERGEASGLSLTDHLDVIESHVGGRFVDAVLANEGPIEDATRARYRVEGAVPLRWPPGARPDLVVLERNLMAPATKLRHDPSATMRGLVELWTAVRPMKSVARVS